MFVTENRCTATPLAFRYASTVFGETLGVGLLRVEDGDLLGAELLDHVLGVTRALDAVVRDDAEERGRRRLRLAADALRQSGVGGRGR